MNPGAVGQLRGSGGVIRSAMTNALNVSGGLDVAGLVLDGTPLDVTGGVLTRFDNVTLRGVEATAWRCGPA